MQNAHTGKTACTFFVFYNWSTKKTEPTVFSKPKPNRICVFSKNRIETEPNLKNSFLTSLLPIIVLTKPDVEQANCHPSNDIAKYNTQLCCHRRILNITWSEHVTNYEVRRRTGQPLLSDTVRTRRLKLFGHVARADKSQDHSHALQACISPTPRNWRRHPGRPRHTWLRTVEEDLRQFSLGLASGLRRAQNRTAWRTLTGTATSPTGSDWCVAKAIRGRKPK